MATTTVQVSSTASGGVTTTTTTTTAAGGGAKNGTNPLNPNDPNAKIDPTKNPQNAQLSKNELDRVTEVFKMYETGLREATIYPRVRIEKYIDCLLYTSPSPRDS